MRRLGDEPSSAVLVKVAAFTKGAGADVREAVRDAPEGAGILLDLRANSGGLVSEAVVAASAFLDGGLVATYDVRGDQHALYADPGGDTDRPVVVLVDGGTMSAAELLTGALQDRGRAVTARFAHLRQGIRADAQQAPGRLGGRADRRPLPHPGRPQRRRQGHHARPRGGERAQQRAETVLSGLGGGS